MARITWQNVTAPDLDTTRLALQQAGNSVSTGLQGFADSFRNIEDIQRDEYSKAALARLAGVTSSNDLNNILSNQGLSGLGIGDTRYLSNDALKSIMDRPTTLYGNELTGAQTNQANASAASMAAAMNRANELQPFKVTEADLANQKTQMSIDAANRNETIRQNDAAMRTRIGQLNNVEEARLAWGQLEKDLAANPSMYSPEIANLIGAGAVAALSGEESTVKAYDLKVADDAAKASSTTTMQQLYNDPGKLGWNKEMFREDAQRRFPEGSAQLKYALEFIDAQPDRLINSDFADEIANNPVLAGAAQSLEQERIQLQGEKLRNPLYSSYKILSGEDSDYSGAYAELTKQLQEPESLWGINSARILNYVNDYAKAHPEVPKDLIAMTVLNGAALDARNLFERNIPLVNDFDLNEGQINTEINRMMSIYDSQNPQQLQTLLELDAREAALQGKTNRFNELLKRGGRAATGTSGYGEADRDRIINQLILDAEALLGRRLRPEETAQVEASVNSSAPGFRSGNSVVTDTKAVSPVANMTQEALVDYAAANMLPGPDGPIGSMPQSVSNALTAATINNTAANNTEFSKEELQNALLIQIQSRRPDAEPLIHEASKLAYTEMSDQQLSIISNTGSRAERLAALAEIEVRKNSR